MVIFPNCKINIGLRILRKRADGFHDLETIFYPLPVKDVLEVVEKRNTANELRDGFINTGKRSLPTTPYVTFTTSDGTIEFNQSGLAVDGNTENNLCIKACQLLKKDFPGLPPVQIHLHKNIPIGAGLGGGSADSAFTLKLINEKFHLNITDEQLRKYAAQIGSDCPFFIFNTPCLATGRGECLDPVQLDLSRFSFVLVSPAIHINTAWAFSAITPSVPQVSLIETYKQPVELWKDQLINDFENPVFKQYPQIKKIKEELYDHGALYASLTGSGSTVYGLFPKKEFPENIWSGRNYRIDKII